MRTCPTTSTTPRALEDAVLDRVTGGGAPAEGNAGPDGGLGSGNVVTDFFAYDPGFRGGVQVVTTETEGDEAPQT